MRHPYDGVEPQPATRRSAFRWLVGGARGLGAASTAEAKPLPRPLPARPGRPTPLALGEEGAYRIGWEGRPCDDGLLVARAGRLRYAGARRALKAG